MLRFIPHTLTTSNCIACHGLQRVCFLRPNNPSDEHYARYDRSWGHLFSSFEGFLSFSWPTVTVTDAYTGRPHIVTRLRSIGAFLKMIKLIRNDRPFCLLNLPPTFEFSVDEKRSSHCATSNLASGQPTGRRSGRHWTAQRG